MDAWSTLQQLFDEEMIGAFHLVRTEALVRSAARAGVREPRSIVAEAVLDRLEHGVTMDEAIESVEDLVAIRHNRMLIDACRRALPDDEPRTNVIPWPGHRRRPITAA